MRIFVCFVVMLFVDVCHQWACKLEDMKLLVRLVQDGDVGLEVSDEDLILAPLWIVTTKKHYLAILC